MTTSAIHAAPDSGKMKAVAFLARERAELVDWPMDATPLKAEEVSGHTLATLISPGTELNGYTVERSAAALSGYAAVFAIDRVGAEVTDLRPGDRVFAMGNHVSYQRMPRSMVVPVPTALAPEIAVFCRLMCVGWSTLITTAARPPDRVLVTGLGPVGNLAAQVFSSAGYRVIAVDPVRGRRDLAATLGVADVREAVPSDCSSTMAVQLAVECSGHERAVLDCCKAVRKGGEVAMVGVPWKKRTDIDAFEILQTIFHRYVHLRSGWEWEVPIHDRDFTVGSMTANLAGALRWLQEGRVSVAGLAQSVQPEDAQQAWQDLLHQRGTGLTRVFDWRG
jgi:threonine dehydrogenase-like Zn-dependent dehydrogenase